MIANYFRYSIIKMARKSSRSQKKTEVLQYTHLTSAEKMKKCRKKKNKQEKKKTSDRELKMKKRAAKETASPVKNKD